MQERLGWKKLTLSDTHVALLYDADSTELGIHAVSSGRFYKGT